MRDRRRAVVGVAAGWGVAVEWWRHGLALCLIVAAGLASGCGEKKLPFQPNVGPPPDPNATFTRVQNEVFTANCAIAGCHATLGAREGMSLASGAAYGSIVRVPAVERPDLSRIEPSNPDKSYLVKKLRGDPDITGLRMPDGGSLTAAQVQLVIDWVRRGAPKD
ncbi:MAG: hypothetical protein ACHQQS_01155 [Thermoanaerobaculales bacterium]